MPVFSSTASSLLEVLVEDSELVLLEELDSEEVVCVSDVLEELLDVLVVDDVPDDSESDRLLEEDAVLLCTSCEVDVLSSTVD